MGLETLSNFYKGCLLAWNYSIILLSFNFNFSIVDCLQHNMCAAIMMPLVDSDVPKKK